LKKVRAHTHTHALTSFYVYRHQASYLEPIKTAGENSKSSVKSAKVIIQVSQTARLNTRPGHYHTGRLPPQNGSVLVQVPRFIINSKFDNDIQWLYIEPLISKTTYLPAQ
jgi:hypothetical protein